MGSESRKLKDKNRILLAEIEHLQQQNKKMNTEISVSNLRQSHSDAKKQTYYAKYSRLKDQYSTILDELKAIKSKHIHTLKQKNSLQTTNNSLNQQIKEIELASTRDTSITFNEDSYLHEMSGILDI